MPFRWKKGKGSRFSQLVADHLHSPKRGGSLVVETGFPTSLVDLFVKNRDRIKKSHKKNRFPVGDSPPSELSKRPDNNCTIVEEIDERDNPFPISSSTSVGGGRTATMAATVLPIDQEIVERDTPIPIVSPAEGGIVERDTPIPIVSSVGVGGARLPASPATNYPIDGEIVEMVNPIPIVSGSGGGVDGLTETGAVGLLMSLLKIFVVVGLALGTKRFVIGITVSAFVLFFLELVGKRLYRNRRFRVSADEHSNLKSVIQRDSCFGAIKPNDQLRIGSGEIQIAEIKFVSEQNSSSGVSFDAGNCNERLVCEVNLESKKMDLEREEKVPRLKHRQSRRAKLKSKMNKLVPKKLRKSKKICSNSESEVSGSQQDDTFEDQEQEQYNIVELNCQEEQQAFSSEFHGHGHDKDSSSRESEAMPIVVVERMGRTSQRGSGNLVLCLIVLFGLVGGRMVALGLALSWCLMLKILTRRQGKVPIVRSSAIISD